ncbi:MAG: conserved membrane protein of unknown function [Promethearchaeota archaeon]|nr:MAG: conserved membrane protein of unknown function [Candidatus Lokiarchaeota archaeon]
MTEEPSETKESVEAEKKKEEKPKEIKKEKTKKPYNENWENIEPLVQTVGKWAWIIALLNGVFYLILNIVFLDIVDIIFSIITLIIAIVYVKPRFSSKCSDKNWDYLYNDVLVIGNIRIPWMLIMGILLEIFGFWWGGAAVLFVAIILLFFGPKSYNWSSKAK